jgi:hypothetical protein
LIEKGEKMVNKLETIKNFKRARFEKFDGDVFAPSWRDFHFSFK